MSVMESEDLMNRASALARMWATAAAERRPGRRARYVQRLAATDAGSDALITLIDRVVRPESSTAAAKMLARIATDGAGFHLGDRAALAAGSFLAPYAPRLAVPAVNARLRALVRHLIVDSSGDGLTRHIASTQAQGYRSNFTVLGEPVLGERRARARILEVTELLSRPDVDYVSVPVSALTARRSPWALEGQVERAGSRLHGVLRAAMNTSPHKFVTLDVDEYADLALMLEVFQGVLAEPEFMHLSAGIELPAYYPDSHEALERLIDFAVRRVEAGGAPVKVRVVKGTNLAVERLNAEYHGWTAATYPSKLDVDASFLRLLRRALRPEVAYALRVGVASHNLFHVAYAHLLAQEQGVEPALDVEMVHGMVAGEPQAVREGVMNPVIMATPVVDPDRLDRALPYVVRQFTHFAAEGNYLHDREAGDLEAQEQAFVAALAHVPADTPRRSHVPAPLGETFASTPEADPSLPATREAMEAALAAPLPVPEAAPLAVSGIDSLVSTAREHGQRWAATPARERAALLRSLARALQAERETLIGVLVKESGRTVGEADAEIVEAIDLAQYYAGSAMELDRLAEAEGLRFDPDRAVLVAPTSAAPLASPVGGMCAAVAAGAAVVVKPSGRAPLAAQIGARLAREALQARGLAPDLVQVALVPDGEAGAALVRHEGIDTVLLAGSIATAGRFTSWRLERERGPRVLAETAGRVSLIITPAADYELAIRDALRSALLHAGQVRAAASLLILVGPLAESERFLTHLVDAVRSVHADVPTDLAAQVGALAEPAHGDLLHALTALDEGEEWLVEPTALDDDGKLWHPGLKAGVRPGSAFHLHHPMGPVMGIMVADTLEQAIEWQNAVDGGLAGGIHSLDDGEIAQWLEAVQVGTAYINRRTTGARAGRQPVGGWTSSAVGPGAKRGGPNFVAQLGAWSQVDPPTSAGEPGARVAQFLDLTAPWLGETDRDWLRASARSDAWARDVYRNPAETTGLESEANILRYRPGPRLTIRAGARARLVDVLRMTVAALTVGIDAGVSVAPEVFALLPERVREQWRQAEEPAEDLVEEPRPAPDGVPIGQDTAGSPIGPVVGWKVEDLDEFTTRASTWREPGRIRLLDPGETPRIVQAVSTAVAVLPGEVLQSGARELLALLSEQTVSRTIHRYGHVGRLEALPEREEH